MPRRALLRFLLLPLLLAAGYAAFRWTPLAGYFTGPALMAAKGRLQHSWWAPALLVGGYLLLSPLGVPATPLMFAGGVLFGGAAGSLYNVVGVILGGEASYFLGRLLGRDLVRHLAGRKLRKVELALGRRGFWNLVAVRFLPLPFPVVNYGAALAGVRPGIFLATLALGILPTVTVYTFFFAALEHAAAGRHTQVYVQLGVMALLLAATLAPQLLRARRRRARLAELRLARRERGRRRAAGAAVAAPPAGLT